MIDDYPAPNTRPHLSKWLLIATDLAMLLLANRLGFWLAERVRIWRDLPAFVASADSGLRLTVWLMLVLAAISWFWLVRGHYTQRRPFWDETRDVVIAMLVLAVVDAALMFMLKSPFSRLWWVATWAVSLFGVVLGRVLTRPQEPGAGLLQCRLSGVHHHHPRHPHDGPAAHYEHGHLFQQPQLYHGRCAGTGHQLRCVCFGDHPRRSDGR